MGTAKPASQPASELEEFFDLSVDLLCIVGLDGRFKRVNTALQRALGYPAEELFSRTVFGITHPDDVARAGEALSHLADGRDLIGFEARVICADGSLRWIEWNTRTVPERGVLYAVGRDTTERRHAEAELRQAQRMLEANRDEQRMLADQQAALRRVATLVARETSPEAVFSAVAEEVGEVLGVDATHLGRFDDDGTVVSVAQWGRYAGVPVGARFALEGDSVSVRVRRTGRPARMDSYVDATGPIADTMRDVGIRVAVGVPVSVEGRPWGVMIATSKSAHPFPPNAEARLLHFTDLVATAVSNASAHARARALADEQAALRRVATLVAREAPQQDVFGAIAEEIGRLLGAESIAMIRYVDERFAVVVASAGPIAAGVPIGTRETLEGTNITTEVFRTRQAARFDDYRRANGPMSDRMAAAGVRAGVGIPIKAEGRLWGAMLAVTADPLPPPGDTEARLGQFTELMATAIANAEARTELARLAGEQAALRRVATLVAEGAPAKAVFDAVTTEVADLLGVSAVSLIRYDADERVVVAQWGTNLAQIAEIARASGVQSVVLAPVVVDGATWGELLAGWKDPAPAPEDTVERMARFAALLGTAIANADSRDQLTASRARVIAAGDEARRRLARDLHDGAQQRLVHTIVTLKLARQAFREDRGSVEALVDDALETAEQATDELRELAHGILPSVLTRGGLRAGVKAVVSRLDLPVEVDISVERLPPDIESSAYFIVAEALTNAVKHAGATGATVKAATDDGVLFLVVGDDGAGGADPAGLGLVGVADRVAALGGRLEIESVAGRGTTLAAWLPLSIRP